ncbi:hypothetical protein V1318_14100 [Lysobacter sp. CCNWLW3]|uniref:hypothetical protein n=1 Tax=unclassified Lysobacter TaxID=2635362 RepID=UPI002FD72571
MSDSFIELDRTFHLSVATGAKNDDVDLTQPFGRRGQMTWADLLAHPRVVILSGGGAGKTFEIRHRAKLLHAEGRMAFFLRIENVLAEFAGAFDKAAGNHEQFLQWVKSGDEGWVFLDSVDEARLKSPKEFERAINYVGRALEPVLQRVHIVITGREAAWRARTDRELIREHLPYESSTPAVTQAQGEEPPAPGGDNEAFETDEGMVDELDTEDDDYEAMGDYATEETMEEKEADAPEVESNSVLIVGFDTLNDKQIETFVRAKKVADAPGFMRAVERKQAQSETARPLDLEGLVDYWNANGKIGDQFELTEATITRRLAEVDPDRAEATTLTRDQLRQAARTLAVANMLMQAPEIRQRDAPVELRGVEPGDLLDWSEKDIRTLLMRPLFVASQFGAVRLYVQKAREFLTAEWLQSRLVDHASRARIEALLFRVQYGQEVVVPAMRGVLPWLALHDPDILARVRRVAPEVMFEGGDPSRLPLDMRRDLLSKACTQLASNPGRSSLTDFQAVQRFAAPDLADHIKALLAAHRDNDDVVYFLILMVWQGEIAGALDEAKQIASGAADFNVRLIALRAIAVLGTDVDLASVRTALLSGTTPPDRELVAEAIETLPYDAAGVTWLLEACVGAKPRQRHSIDPLPDAVEAYVASMPSELLPQLVEGLQTLMTPAVDPDDDDGRGRLSYSWLTGAAIAALDRLVQAKDPVTLQAPAMALLLRIPAAVRLGDSGDREDSARLAEHVRAWAAINRALFWADVEGTRARRLKKSGEALVNFWAVGIFGHYWSLTTDDFDFIEGEIGDRPLLEDRQVALSAAFILYRDNGRLPHWRQRLRRRVKGVLELEAALAVMFGPQSEEIKKWRRQEARWKERSARKAAKLDANRKEWREYLKANVDTLRTPPTGGGIRNSQHYLSTRMREFDKNSSRWTDGKWRSLIPEFGNDVATAFRDGAIAFWRTNTPKLLSNGAEANSTPGTTVFGLTGLLLESRESRDWAMRLTPDEADLATRYAAHELNGFPPWLPQLFAAHPEPVLRVVLAEIDYELGAAVAIDSPSHYMLSDVSGVGNWLWPRLARELLKRLNSPVPSATHLRQILIILAGSDVADAEIAARARKYTTSMEGELAAIWFGAWIGVEPEQALPALAARLASLPDKAQQVEFAMHCLTSLAGGHRKRRVSREAYHTVPHLTTLFLLMHQYIVEDEDLQRAGKGVYSPVLRDDAQEARDALLAPLRDTPGQDAYFALQRVASEHPSKRGRDWAARLARARAAADADRPGWLGSQVREFQQSLERTPRTPQELYDLAIDRLLDLKHSLEHGETSIAAVLLAPEETAVRNVVADWCKTRGLGRYQIAQEEEFADKKRTDVRFLGMNFDNPVPVELKLANLWTGAQLAERLENQLCNDYLRDQRSSRGIFLLMHQGDRLYWDLPDGSRVRSVEALSEGLLAHWAKVAQNFPHVHAVHVIGIDLTLRSKPKGRTATKKPAKKTGKTTAKKSSKKAAKKITKKAAEESVAKPNEQKATAKAVKPAKKAITAAQRKRASAARKPAREDGKRSPASRPRNRRA